MGRGIVHGGQKFIECVFRELRGKRAEGGLTRIRWSACRHYVLNKVEVGPVSQADGYAD